MTKQFLHSLLALTVFLALFSISLPQAQAGNDSRDERCRVIAYVTSRESMNFNYSTGQGENYCTCNVDKQKYNQLYSQCVSYAPDDTLSYVYATVINSPCAQRNANCVVGLPPVGFNQ
jgi:hypothetical protein